MIFTFLLIREKKRFEICRFNVNRLNRKKPINFLNLFKRNQSDFPIFPSLFLCLQYSPMFSSPVYVCVCTHMCKASIFLLDRPRIFLENEAHARSNMPLFHGSIFSRFFPLDSQPTTFSYIPISPSDSSVEPMDRRCRES